MKRHERPWGCTQCEKSFGSKGDWKRHENSQHFQHESWKCQEMKDGKECGKITYHPENFKSHLSKAHKITQPCDQQLNKHRVSQSFESEFWCGFCEEIVNVDPTGQGIDAWSERFNHIDNHFWGKRPFAGSRKSILDWKAQSKDVSKDKQTPKVPKNDLPVDKTPEESKTIMNEPEERRPRERMGELRTFCVSSVIFE